MNRRENGRYAHSDAGDASGQVRVCCRAEGGGECERNAPAGGAHLLPLHVHNARSVLLLRGAGGGEGDSGREGALAVAAEGDPIYIR